MPFFVYIVECADKTLYTGWTTDITRRLQAHNAGRGAKYTRSRRPVHVVYLEEVADQSEALKREYAIKQMRRRAKLKLIHQATLPSPQALIRKPLFKPDEGRKTIDE